MEEEEKNGTLHCYVRTFMCHYTTTTVIWGEKKKEEEEDDVTLRCDRAVAELCCEWREWTRGRSVGRCKNLGHRERER